MSSGPVATASVLIKPDLTGFKAELQRGVDAAIKGVVAAVPVRVAGGAAAATGAPIAASAASAAAISNVGAASRKAATDVSVMENESRALRGALIGLSHITPVTVFGLGLVGTAAIAGGLAFKAAVGSAAELEQQLNVFQAVTGATDEQLKQVSATSKALGADLALPATSANDAADAMTTLAKAGLTVNDTLAASRGVLQLAAAANISAGDAANIAATQLNAFKLAGEEATHVTDLLAGASIAAQGDINDFALGFQQAAAVAHQVGLTVDQTAALLTELGKAGLRGSDGGTSLRVTLLRLVPTTKQAAEFVEKLGINIDKNVSVGGQLTSIIEQYRTALLRLTPIQQQEALTQIFGQDAVRAASIIFTQSAGSLQALQDQISQTGSGAKLAEARMKGFAGAVEGLKSQASTLGATFGTQLLPALTSTTHALSGITTTATDALEVLDKLGSVTVKPVVNLLGGTDTVANIGLAVGAGLGLRALARRRAAHKAATTAEISEEDAVAKAATTAIETVTKASVASIKATTAAATAGAVAVAKVGAVAVETSKQQALAQGKVIPALVETNLLLDQTRARWLAAGGAAKLSAAEQVTAAGRVGQAAARARGLIAGQGALGVGLGLTVAGGLLPGAAGSIATAAGTGAIVGSFFGPEAAVAGAGIFGAIAAIKEAKERSKRDRQKVLGDWKSLDYQQQQAFLRAHFPSRSDPEAIRNLVAEITTDAKTGPAARATAAAAPQDPFPSVDTTAPDVLSRTRVVADSARADLIKQRAALVKQREGQQNLADFAKAGVFTVNNAKAQVVNLTAQIRSLDAKLADLGDAGTQTAEDFLQSVGGFTFPPEDIAHAKAGLQATILNLDDITALGRARNKALAGVGLILTKVPKIPKFVQAKLNIDTASIRENKLAVARLNDDTDELVQVLSADIAKQRSAFTKLQEKATAPLPISTFLDPEKRTKFIDDQIKVVKLATKKAKDLKAAIDELNQIEIADIQTPSFSLTLAGTEAAGTKTLTDDLANAQARVKETEDKISKFNKNTTKEVKNAAKLELETRKNAVTAVNDAVTQQTKQAAADEKQAFETALGNTQTRLEQAAEAAGHQGVAEKKLIAFYQKEAHDTRLTTAQQLQFVSLLRAEKQNAAAAITALAKAQIDLQNEILNTRLSAAELTPGEADNKRVLRQQIRLIQEDINAQKKIKADRHKSLLIRKEAAIQIQKDLQQINNIKGQIKGLAGESSFSLQDLFKEAVSNFETFGSNIGGRDSVLSPQDSRAQLAKIILNRRDAVRDIGDQIKDGIKQVGEEAKKAVVDIQKTVQAFKLPGVNRGLLEQGNIDILHRPTVPGTKPGTTSSVKSISVQAGDFDPGFLKRIGIDVVSKTAEILIPEVIKNAKGQFIVGTEKQAREAFRKTGQNLGVFKDVASANAYANRLHLQQAAMKPPTPASSPILNLGQSQLTESQKQTRILGSIDGKIGSLRVRGQKKQAAELVGVAGNLGGWRAAQEAADNLYGAG